MLLAGQMGMTMKLPRCDKTITIDEIWVRCCVDSRTGCWTWIGWKDKQGYGRWHAARTQFGTPIVHRISYLLENGSLPEWPLVLDHICGNKSCANPKHLRVIGHLENSDKGIKQIRPETCPRGHNNWRERAGGRVCQDCKKLYKQRYRARRKLRSET